MQRNCVNQQRSYANRSHRRAVLKDPTKICAVWESWSDSREVDRLVKCDGDIVTICSSLKNQEKEG